MHPTQLFEDDGQSILHPQPVSYIQKREPGRFDQVIGGKESALQIRDGLKDYVNSDIGAVEWQMRHVTDLGPIVRLLVWRN